MKLEKFPADEQECKLIFILSSFPPDYVHIAESKYKEE